MTATAIETEYRGYRMRSRLEARWAVVFDALRLRWRYECQGYLVGEEKRPYLPDFWVQDLYAWVEVKGDPDMLDHALVDAAVSPEGLPGTDLRGNRNLLILGDIPDPAELHGWLHHLIWWPPDSLFARCSTVALQHFSQRVMEMAAKKIAMEDGFRHSGIPVEEWPRAHLCQIERDKWFRPQQPAPDLVTPRPCSYLRPDPVVSAAFKAARSARFEHGENPEPPEPTPTGREAKPVSELLKGRLGEILERRRQEGGSA